MFLPQKWNSSPSTPAINAVCGFSDNVVSPKKTTLCKGEEKEEMFSLCYAKKGNLICLNRFVQDVRYTPSHPGVLYNLDCVGDVKWERQGGRAYPLPLTIYTATALLTGERKAIGSVLLEEI